MVLVMLCVLDNVLIIIWSSEVLTRTPSHICGRLYLPMFLLRMGLFTLMYMDSFIVVAKLCPSLPTMLKLFNVGGLWLSDGHIRVKVPFNIL